MTIDSLSKAIGKLHKEFTYLLYDSYQSTPEKIRLISKIIPSQGIMTVHMNERTV